MQDAAQHHERQEFYRPHTSMGAVGHWVKTAGILAPLIIGEFVKDTEKRWQWTRLASVTTALISEGMWQHKLQRERDDCREHERT